jgi:hypothetical protein
MLIKTLRANLAAFFAVANRTLEGKRKTRIDPFRLNLRGRLPPPS